MASSRAPMGRAEEFPRLDVATVRAAFSSGDATGWSELHRRHGDTLWLPNGLLLTIDLDIVEAMLMNRPHTETRPALYRHARRVIPGADGLLFQTHPLWKRQLLAVTPVFHKAHLSKVAQGVTETIQRHAAEWARVESVPDLYAAMSRMGADVALRALFGIDGRMKAGRRIAEILTRYKLATMQHAPHARMDRADATPMDMLGSLAANAMTIVSLVRDVRALDRSLAEIECGALDGCIASLRDVAPSRKALVSWVNHLFGAYNAVDYTIVAALVLLEHHPAVRHALEAELEGAAARDPSPELHAELPTLHNFAREVFRVAPVANAVLREVAVPLTVPGARLQPGTQVALGVRALHHDDRHWAEPWRFDPSRWAGPAAPHAPFAYIPFLAGPRQCWGRRLAEMVFVQTLRELLGRRSVRVLTPDARPTAYIMPRFTVPVRAQVTARREGSGIRAT
jgi:enediyne biosynthesis protein E7